MTLSDMRTLTLGWLDDPNGGYFSTSLVNTWLNNAQKEVQKRLLMAGVNWYLKCVQTTLVANQNIYLLPQDFRHLNRLEVITSGTFPNESRNSMAPITLNQQDYTTQHTGTPESYVLRKKSIQTFPVPDSALVLRLNYSYMVADMILDTDVADVPDQYQEFIPVLATLDGNIKDRTDMSGILEKKRFYEEMLKSDASLRTADQPRTIIVTEDDNYGSMF